MRCPSSFGRPGWSAADGAGNGGHAALLPPGAAGAAAEDQAVGKAAGAPVRLSHSTPCLVGAVPLAGASAYPAHLSGQPYFPDFPEVHFNLSHTTGAVLVALSGEPVGVDIEHIRPVSERAMRRLADVTTERAFFQSWVRREARGQAQRRRRGDHAGVGDPAPAWGAILFSGHLSGLCGGSGHPGRGPARPGAQILPG